MATAQIVGAYRLKVTADLLKAARKKKYGVEKLPWLQELLVPRIIQRELDNAILFEVAIRGADLEFDMDDFGQRGSDQAPYEEVYLEPDGKTVIGRNFPTVAPEDFNVAFFLHFVNANRPLQSSYGDLIIPKLQDMPERLRNLVPYVPVG